MGLNDRMPTLAVRAVDHGLWSPAWTIRDFRDPTGEISRWGQEGASIKEILCGFPRSLSLDQWVPGNCLLNEGINELWTLVAGTGATKFDSANAYIGAGDSNTGEAATQTGLQAASNKLYKAMDGGYPTYGTSQKGTWRSTFGTTEANWPWEEVTVANGNSDAAKNLNRKVQSFGTKSALYARIATAEIALS
jgi:hypothetical protein